ncbi:UvrD-helicase domain-containing protein [Marinitenerispora sediminis]|uniref:UvrD-helicase domain-containing protein n=1 Tax=Marinitenerispora sediminis TaxID=1931232 RepID=UPI000DF2C3E5|nr:UvrD-helicase domain-containing protein [Marinitenerispora sediminis]RCV58191.1 RNA helicase [Marinitenerispora sediminis]RCV61472.1 RNA helicase [Marinitenerispora sediminis]
MPQLAIAPAFLNDFSQLDTRVQAAALTAVQAYLAGDRPHLGSVDDAADARVRMLPIGPEWAGVVAPTPEDGYCLITIRPHDEALAFARRFRPGPVPVIDIVDVPHHPAPLPAAPAVVGPVEIARHLRGPFDQWQITLHPDQRRLAEGRFAGSVQVTGGPGTGKTVLALHRAAHLAAALTARPRRGTRPVLLTTYNRLLAQTLSSHLDRIVPDPDVRSRIEVVTIDGLARAIVQEHSGMAPDALAKEVIAERWRDAARADGIPYSGRFLVDEWEQVILARGFTDPADYIRCERSGRVLHLAPEHRRLVWDTVRRYTGAMRVAGEWSFPQVAEEAARILRRSGPRYAHIVVDEAQDLHPAQWRLLRAAVAEGPDDLFIAGDPHQRIYDSRVSLASLGIQVRGRGHRLRVGYRITQETLNWALPILGRVPAVGLDDNADTLAGYRSLLRGPRPVVRGCSSRHEEMAALGEWVRTWLEAGVAPSSIAVAGRNRWVVRDVAKELLARGIRTAPVDAEDDIDAVRVGTMHKLKGQEYRCVAVVGVGESQVPPRAATDAAEGDPVALEQIRQQERNLLFVACTRARDALYVSHVGARSRLLPPDAGAAD